MIQHVKRLGLVVGLSMYSLLACAPASAQGPQADAGTPAAAQARDAGTAAPDGGTARAEPQSEARPEAGAKGSRCSGKATFCAVYSQTFCSSQPGCSWSFSTSTCTGLAPKCETATNEAFCKKVKGCKWQ